MLKVLIVEDEPADRSIIRTFLERLHEPLGPCDITEASSMVDGLALLRRVGPDCIILDHGLPDGDGMTFLRRANELLPDVTHRVLMLTGDERIAVAVEAMKLGAADYLSKDKMTPSGLVAAVSRTAERAEQHRRWLLAEEERRAFAHTAAHDLKAPLRQIRQFSELLQLRHGEDLGPDGQRYLDRITETTSRMHRLVQGLLDYATVTDDGLEPGPVSLDDVTRHVLALLAEPIAAAEARIEVESPLGELVGYGELLGRLVQNLVANALKFRGDEPPKVVISVARKDDELRLSVRDHGIGIAKHDQARIFEPFTRLHGRDRYDGTGLGLATCLRVAELHKARLEVTSSPGEGSCFTLVLRSSEYAAPPCRLPE